MQDVLAELSEWKGAGGEADHITLAGSGEPTLHIHFGEVFRWVKDNTDIRSVLLTNGTLLHHADVREAAALADKVKVTLSAWDEASFQRIHRPARGVTFELLVQGERAFRERYAGELSVEVFIVEGMNASVEQAKRIAEVVRSIHPDRIDINTVVRPPAVKGIHAPAESRLQSLAELFGESATVTAALRQQGSASGALDDDALLALIRRHPATCRQLAGQFNIPEERVLSILKGMEQSGLVRSEVTDSETYFYCRAD
jgi:wyosine [tRNA(Phe)-imidazoG37] synthetase (radical SAM superfamily)